MILNSTKYDVFLIRTVHMMMSRTIFDWQTNGGRRMNSDTDKITMKITFKRWIGRSFALTSTLRSTLVIVLINMSRYIVIVVSSWIMNSFTIKSHENPLRSIRLFPYKSGITLPISVITLNSMSLHNLYKLSISLIKSMMNTMETNKHKKW